MSHKDDLSIGTLTSDHIVEVLTKLDDRAAAIMATSIVETVLSSAINYKFRRLPTDSDNNLIFGGFGPLATFSAKILIGYHMGVVSADVRHDLRIVKDIRNEFAHNFSPLSFSSAHIADRCRSLKLKNAKIREGSPLGATMPSGARGQFVCAVLSVIGHLVMHFAFMPHERKLLAVHERELIEKATASFKQQDFGQ